MKSPLNEEQQKKLLEISFDDLIVRFEQLKTAMQFIERPTITQTDISTFLRLIKDDRLSSKITVKYPENVSRILTKLNQEFGFETNLLEPFLRGQKSLSEVLGPEIITQASEFFDVVDFIDRRKLFG